MYGQNNHVKCIFFCHTEEPLKSVNQIKNYKWIPFPVFAENCSICNERNIHQEEKQRRKIGVISRENEALPTRVIKKRKMRKPTTRVLLFFVSLSFETTLILVCPPWGYHITYLLSKKNGKKLAFFSRAPPTGIVSLTLWTAEPAETCVLFSSEFDKKKVLISYFVGKKGTVAAVFEQCCCSIHLVSEKD